MQSRLKKWVVRGAFVVVLVAIIILYYRYISFERLQQDREWLLTLVTQYPIRAVCIYIITCTAIISAAIPGIVPMSLIGGFLFGAPLGTLYATVGATLGVMIMYIWFSYLIEHSLFSISQNWYGKRISQLMTQVHTYGYTYLLTMHWMTVIPFSIVAAVAALAAVPLVSVAWTTVIGSIPMIFIYALAGRELGTITRPGDIFSWKVMGAFLLLALLALVPMVIKRSKINKNP